MPSDNVKNSIILATSLVNLAVAEIELLTLLVQISH